MKLYFLCLIFKVTDLLKSIQPRGQSESFWFIYRWRETSVVLRRPLLPLTACFNCWTYMQIHQMRSWWTWSDRNTFRLYIATRTSSRVHRAVVDCVSDVSHQIFCRDCIVSGHTALSHLCPFCQLPALYCPWNPIKLTPFVQAGNREITITGPVVKRHDARQTSIRPCLCCDALS